MVVRWLGAYGKGPSLVDSLRFELTRPKTDEVAAEPIDNRNGLKFVSIGLVVKRRAVRRVYSGDVFSQPCNRLGLPCLQDENGFCDETCPGCRQLRTTRKPKHGSLHGEAICNPDYCAIAVRGVITPKAWKIVKVFSKAFGLPIKKLAPPTY